MKTIQLNNRVPLLFAIVIIVLFLACKKQYTGYPLDNRCGDPSVTVTQNTNYNILYSTTKNQLSAGDITGSLQTSSGKTVWFVNNALLNSDAGSIHLDNCLVIQESNTTTVAYNNSSGTPQSLIPALSTDSWYTINNAIENNGRLELVVSLISKTGNGAYDFSVKSTSVVTINAGTFAIINMFVVIPDSDIRWGAAIYQYAGYTYVFGARNNGFTKDGLIARVSTGSITQSWNFYNGYNWTPDLEDAKPILSGLSDYFSVFIVDGTFYLLSQSSLFGQQVNIYRAVAPGGQWDFYKLLYCRADDGGNTLAANTILHSLAGNGNTLVCSYSAIDKSLNTTTPYTASFINISNWR